MEVETKRRLEIIAGSCNTELAGAVAKELGVRLSEPNLAHFANGEIHCQISRSVRGSDVYVFQTHGRPVNEAIMEQAIIIDAARRASAARITAVCPFFGYARQDRKAGGREPITARLVVEILTAAGADRIVSVDLHSGQIQGFFNGPFDHLTAMPLLRDYIARELGRDVVIVSPDAGRVKTAERYSRQLGADLAIVHKVRSSTRANVSEARQIVGEVQGRRCVVIDDMIDTAGTVVAAAGLLKSRGADEIYIMATHGVLSDPAVERLEAAPIKQVVVTDTLPVTEETRRRLKKLQVVSVAPMVAAAVKAIFLHKSVSEIFEGENHR
jgi:ribose-phosphate pyrophosphokinase